METILEILTTGEFDRLLGLPEDDRLEFKSGVYPLPEERAKHELAKDICGMLNAGGGVIVLGARTTKDPTRFADVVSEVMPFAQSLVDPDQLRKTAATLIYPALPVIPITWHPSQSESSKGVVSLQIPVPPDADLPFLMVRALDDERRLHGSLYGYFERKVANVEALSAPQMHLRFREGLRSIHTQRQYDTILMLLQRIDSDRTDRRAKENATQRSQRFATLRAEAERLFLDRG